MIQVQTYKESHFAEILELLNTSKKYDHFTKPLLHEKLYDDPDWKPEQAFVALHNKKVVGFMQGVTRYIRGSHYGYIKLMAVQPSFQRQGIATKLFFKLENHFKHLGIKVFRIYDVPLNYFMPGIDPRYTPAICFAQKMGFEHCGDAINMKVDLTVADWNVSVQLAQFKSNGISISRAIEADKATLFEFIKDEWALWQYELEMAFRSNPIAIYIARYEGSIKAFSAYNGNNLGTGWFGPMGTHADLRGKGVGSVLLYLCLNDMKKLGHKSCTIPWVAPISFYAHYAQAEIDRVFWRFEKKISYE